MHYAEHCRVLEWIYQEKVQMYVYITAIMISIEMIIQIVKK